MTQLRLERDLYRAKLEALTDVADKKINALNDHQWWKQLLWAGIGFTVASLVFWGAFGIYKIIQPSPYGAAVQ